MKPQSKITIFMVVMIVMLSIYYFTLGNDDKNKNNNLGGPNNQPTFRYDKYEELRNDLNSKRQTMIEGLNSELVSSDLSEQEKNETFSYIVELQNMTTRELNFEELLRNEDT